MTHVIGLTGGIASGKSTVARMLIERGAVVIDADQLARQVVEPGQPALAELVSRFGAAILTPDGRLDRPRLAAIAFDDPSARADLGRITHPRIAAASAAAIAQWADAGANIVFYEAALLVENRAHAALAGLIVVAASAEAQASRASARDGLSAAAAHARIAAQLPLADKIAVATWVIDNSAGADELAREVDRVVADIEAKHGPIRVAAPTRAARVAAPSGEVALVTGFPAFTARRMVAKILAAEPTTKLYVLARERFAAAAQAQLDALGAGDRAEVIVGDVCDMDLGLASGEYRALTRELTWIHHLAGIYFQGVDDRISREVNIGGTRGVLDLALDATRLTRLVHWSTALVSGDRRGNVLEGDLDIGQRFPSAWARSKLAAEKLARAAMRRLPVTIVRPSLIVGDSRTGEIDKLDGPYYLMVLIATNASRVRLPLIGPSEHPLHVVPVDYVIDAAWTVARSERAPGRTFHLVDPSPMSARDVFDRVADIAHTEKPRGHIPRAIARAVLRTPGLSRLGRGPLGFLDAIDHAVRYDATNTIEALAGTGVRCPPLADYLPQLVRYVLDVARPVRVPREDEVIDPLA